MYARTLFIAFCNFLPRCKKKEQRPTTSAKHCNTININVYIYANVQFRLEKCLRREKRSANKKKAQRVAVNIYHLQNESFRTDLRIRFFLHFQCICVPRFRVICTSPKPIMNIHKKILDTLQNHKPNVWQWINSIPKHTVFVYYRIGWFSAQQFTF